MTGLIKEVGVIKNTNWRWWLWFTKKPAY